MLTYAIRKTTLCVALTPAVSTQALAATEIPFWHSMEGELGKEVDSTGGSLQPVAQRRQDCAGL